MGTRTLVGGKRAALRAFDHFFESGRGFIRVGTNALANRDDGDAMTMLMSAAQALGQARGMLVMYGELHGSAPYNESAYIKRSVLLDAADDELFALKLMVFDAARGLPNQWHTEAAQEYARAKMAEAKRFRPARRRTSRRKARPGKRKTSR